MPMADSETLRDDLPPTVTVGRVLRPHGLKGELSVLVESEVPGRFDPGSDLLAVLDWKVPPAVFLNPNPEAPISLAPYPMSIFNLAFSLACAKLIYGERGDHAVAPWFNSFNMPVYGGLNQWGEPVADVFSEDFEDILDFRIAIETRAAALAAQRRDDDDLAAMEAALERILAVDLRSSFRQADAMFHNAVAQASRNLRLKQAIPAARGELFIPLDRLVYKELVDSSYRGHRAVCDAIRRRDAAAAASAMQAHIEEARRELRSILFREEP